MELVSYLVSDCVGSQELSTMYVLKLIQQQMKMCKELLFLMFWSLFFSICLVQQ